MTGDAPARGAGERLAVALAFAAIVVGIALRLAAVGGGLPFVYDPDEPELVERAFRMLETGDLNPRWFGHPGSTALYAFLLAFAGHAATLGGSIDSLAAAFRYDPAGYYLVARAVIAAFAAGSLVLTWLVARRVGGTTAALLAVALLAVAPLHTQYSRIAHTDVEMIFFVLASFLGALSVHERGRLRDYLAAGFFLGLAIATKYPAVVFALSIALAHAWGQVDRGGRPWHAPGRLAGSAAATVAGVFVGSPWLLFSPGVVLKDVLYEARSYHLGGTSEGFLHSLGWYLSGPLLLEVGLLGAALVLIGLASGLRSRDRRVLLAGAAPFAFLLFISSLSLRWERWALPAVPFLCMLAGVGLRETGAALAALASRRIAALGTAVLVVVAVAPVALNSVGWTVAAARDETRNHAWRWIVANVPPGSRILLEAYAPQLEPQRYALYTVSGGRIWRLDAGGRRYAVPTGIVGTLADPAAVARAGIDYVVLANHYDRRLAEPERYARELAVYEEIMRQGERVFAVEPAEWEAVGLPVRVYRVRR